MAKNSWFDPLQVSRDVMEDTFNFVRQSEDDLKYYREFAKCVRKRTVGHLDDIIKAGFDVNISTLHTYVAGLHDPFDFGPLSPDSSPKTEEDYEAEKSHMTTMVLSPLHVCIEYGWMEGFCLLLMNGAAISHEDNGYFHQLRRVETDKVTPLMRAISRYKQSVCWNSEDDKLIMLRLLIRYGADINQCDSQSGISPLILAGKTGYDPLTGKNEVADLLLENGADANSNLLRLFTVNLPALSAENKIQMLDLLQRLLSHKADVNAYDQSILDVTPLMVAARDSDIRAVQLLLDNGANVNRRVFSGSEKNCAIMEALSNGNVDVLKLLLRYGADLNWLVNCFNTGTDWETADRRRMSLIRYALQSRGRAQIKMAHMLLMAGSKYEWPTIKLIHHLAKHFNVSSVHAILKPSKRSFLRKVHETDDSLMGFTRFSPEPGDLDLLQEMSSYVLQPRSLQHSCRIFLKNMIVGNDRIMQLPLPKSMQDYLCLADICKSDET